MVMSSVMKYELKAECFRMMTGHIAPGKDAPAAFPSEPYETRLAEWKSWWTENSEAVSAMLAAIETIVLRDDT